MPFSYDPPGNAELRQGEIIGPVYEHRARHAAHEVQGEPPFVDSEIHSRMLVVTAECDLWKDYQARADNAEAAGPDVLHHVLLCDVYSDDEIAGVLPAAFGSRDRRGVTQNQNERYHYFPQAPVGQTETVIPPIYLDFKRCIGFPPQAIYGAITSGHLARIACVPPVFLQDLVHRLHNFLSRVGPDFE